MVKRREKFFLRFFLFAFSCHFTWTHSQVILFLFFFLTNRNFCSSLFTYFSEYRQKQKEQKLFRINFACIFNEPFLMRKIKKTFIFLVHFEQTRTVYFPLKNSMRIDVQFSRTTFVHSPFFCRNAFENVTEDKTSAIRLLLLLSYLSWRQSSAQNIKVEKITAQIICKHRQKPMIRFRSKFFLSLSCDWK